MLPYTICFCLCGKQVLMLYRSKPPNAGRWNGLGGKIEIGETPLAGIQREMLEEAAIDLRLTGELRYAGIVTWISGKATSKPDQGMYVFLAQLAPDFLIEPDHSTAEGILAWKPLDWVCDPSNSSVVSNISRFLPLMLKNTEPQEYRCFYRFGLLRKVTVRSLSPMHAI